MPQKLLFKRDQLVWIEEVNREYFVDVIIQPKGITDPFREPPLAGNIVRLGNLSSYVSQYPEHNVWRSWNVFRDKNREIKLGLVPLFFDVDDESDPPNLSHSYKLAATCLDLLESSPQWGLASDRLRVVFSGHKGFHIEVKPTTEVDGEQVRRALLAGCEQKGIDRMNNTFFNGTTALDTFSPRYKPWIRVTGTLYSWHSKDGHLLVRRIFQMSPEQFRALKQAGIEKAAKPD